MLRVRPKPAPTTTPRYVVLGCLAMLIAVLSSSVSAPTRAADLTVFGAASLKNALDDVDAAFTRSTGVTVSASYAASSALARQIEEGAPADVFISADLDWMDALAKRDLIKPETRGNLLGNDLVMVTPAEKPVAIDILPGMPLVQALSGGRLAIPLVEAVPAGKYGKAALTKLGVWAAVEPHLTQAENVRAALTLVARGEAPLGIVYSTDALSEPKVTVAGVFPADTHPPIIYPVALTAASKAEAGSRYLLFLHGPEAAALFKAQGFTVLN